MSKLEVPVSNWSSIDDETTSLILSLLLDDIKHATSSGKGKQVEGTLADIDLAIQLYTEELEKAAMFTSDHRMTKSIQMACQMDSEALIQSEREEQMAHHDHEVSTLIQQQNSEVSGTEIGYADPSVAELELLDKLSAIYITGIDDDKTDDEGCVEIANTETAGQPECSSWAASRKSQNVTRTRRCLACDEKTHFTNLARATCGHEYCRDCLGQLFQNAMSDETLFPPRCCRQPIPLDQNLLFLAEDLVRQFRVKAVEFTTPQRTYCSRRTCSAFIHPDYCQLGIATCADCGHQTCTTCKGPSHSGDCPHDEDLQKVLEIAKEERWQRCPGCLSMIELETGCFHMT